MSEFDISDFNAANYEPNAGVGPLEKGSYIAAIVESEIKDASTGQGNKYIKFVWQVLQGPSSGRKVFQNLNVVHQSKDTENIGRGWLSTIYRAQGKLVCKHTSELHNVPMRIQVGIKAGSGKYGDSNTILKIEGLKDSGIGSKEKVEMQGLPPRSGEEKEKTGNADFDNDELSFG